MLLTQQLQPPEAAKVEHHKELVAAEVLVAAVLLAGLLAGMVGREIRLHLLLLQTPMQLKVARVEMV
jgi:hypothetical protein